MLTYLQTILVGVLMLGAASERQASQLGNQNQASRVNQGCKRRARERTEERPEDHQLGQIFHFYHSNPEEGADFP